MPKVLNIRFDGVPKGAVVVDRSSIYGNPFRIGKDGTRETVVKKHRRWLLENLALLRRVPLLRGEDCACWCAPLPCHADTLVEIANEEGAEPTIEWARRRMRRERG